MTGTTGTTDHLEHLLPTDKSRNVDVHVTPAEKTIFQNKKSRSRSTIIREWWLASS